MLSKSLLDAQTTVELPAREMLGVFNFAIIGANQQAGNLNTQVNAVGALQLNLVGQSNTNAILVAQG
jgi:hypothetical protein